MSVPRRRNRDDAVDLAAVALNRQFAGVVSTDRAFGDVPGLHWIDPSSLPTRLS